MSQHTILSYGIFDLFHASHLNLLWRFAALEDRLVVGISSDDVNLIGKKSIFP